MSLQDVFCRSFIISGFLCFVLVSQIEGELRCAEGWTLYFKGQECVKWYKDRRDFRNWGDARMFCQDNNADLVKITNNDKQQFIRGYTKGYTADIYIGLHRVWPRFRWLDEKIDATYFHWNRGEPNNIGGQENCISLQYRYDGNWNDGVCSKKTAFLCEKLAYNYETSTTALSTEALTTLGNTSLTTVPQTSTATTKTTISSSTSTTTGATRTVTATTALDDTTTSVNSQDFTCNLTSFSIDVHVPLDVAPNSKLTLRDKSCELKSDGRNYVIHFRFDECGSSVSYFSDRVYINNDINVHKDLGPISAPIVFDSDYKINIKCSLERKKLIEGSFQTVTRDPITEENSHHVNIHHTQSILKEFRTEKYEDEITDFPAKVPINREIFMELSLNKQQDNLGIEIVNCVATPTTDPNDLLSYQLIANGCPSSPVVHLMPSGSVVKRRFKVQAFHFSGPSNTDNKVYIHCQIKYCLIDVCAIPACRRRRSALVGRQATKSRQLKAKRRRRNLIGSSDSHSVFLGIGPLTVE